MFYEISGRINDLYYMQTPQQDGGNNFKVREMTSNDIEKVRERIN